MHHGGGYAKLDWITKNYTLGGLVVIGFPTRLRFRVLRQQHSILDSIYILLRAPLCDDVAIPCSVPTSSVLRSHHCSVGLTWQPMLHWIARFLRVALEVGLWEREKGDFNKKGKFLNVRVVEHGPLLGLSNCGL
jgi:hypothetical protein